MTHESTCLPPGTVTVASILNYCPAFDAELTELIAASWDEQGGTQDELVEFLWTNCVIDNAGREVLHDCIRGVLDPAEVAGTIQMLSLDRLFESLQMIDVEATSYQLTEEVGPDVEYPETEDCVAGPKQQDHWNQYNHGEFISFSTEENSLSNLVMMPDPVLRRPGALSEQRGENIGGHRADLDRYCRGRHETTNDPRSSTDEIYGAAAALLRELQAC